MSVFITSRGQDVLVLLKSFDAHETVPRSSLSLTDISVEMQVMIYGFVFGAWEVIFAPLPAVAQPSTMDFMRYPYARDLYRWCKDDCDDVHDSPDSHIPVRDRDMKKRSSIIYTCKAISGTALEARHKSFTGRFGGDLFSKIAVSDVAFEECMQSSKYAKTIAKIHTVRFWHNISKTMPDTALSGVAELLPTLRTLDHILLYRLKYLGEPSNYAQDGNTDMTTMEVDFIESLRPLRNGLPWNDFQLLALRIAGYNLIELRCRHKFSWTLNETMWQHLIIPTRVILSGPKISRQLMGPLDCDKQRDYKLL